MLFSDVVAADILWMRRKLNAPNMVNSRSPDSITCKGTSGLQFDHIHRELQS